MKNKLFFILFLAFHFQVIASSAKTKHYLIYFKDKANSGFSIDKPWEYLSIEAIDRRNKFGIHINQFDLPVNENYIKTIQFYDGIQVLHASKWLNAIHLVCTDTGSLKVIRTLTFVVKIEYLGTYQVNESKVNPEIDSAYYQKAIELTKIKDTFNFSHLVYKDYKNSLIQNSIIGVPTMHKSGNTGKGIHISVFDAGFKNAYKTEGMADLLNKQTFIRDFVNDDNSVWEDDQHGANVLGFMKTFNPGQYIGSAPLAKYSLFRTEIADAEILLEELNWVLAAECADSIGTDMIIGSLGYHTFDETELNHEFSDMNGQSSLVAKGANIAHNKGIIVICSAGNEGNKKWRKIGTPADAFGSYCIGASDLNGVHAGFSSMGYSYDGRIKPNFTAPGLGVTVASPNGFYKGNGTSYSTPIFAGAFACLMQYRPIEQPDSLMKAVIFASTHRHNPDSLYGYGIPDFGLALYRLGFWVNQVHTDMYWSKEVYSVFFQDINIYLLSYTDQTVKIEIQGLQKRKLKSIFKKSIRMSAGKWFDDDFMMEFFKQMKSKKYKQIKINITTEHETFSKLFKFD